MTQTMDSIIDDSKKLRDDDRFCFSCTPEKDCFTACCHDLTLILMPYDILRLKNRLGMKSGDFLRRYTTVHVGPGSGLPIITVKMEGPSLKCPFLEEGRGCTVYEDRPGACRTYPLARMTCRSRGNDSVDEFYYIVREPDCLGFRQGREWSVREWKGHEELDRYNRFNDMFGEILQAKNESNVTSMNADQIDLFYTACYDMDGFRVYFLEGPNLDRYMEDKAVLDRISGDEEELLIYGMNWVTRKLFQGGCVACSAS